MDARAHVAVLALFLLLATAWLRPLPWQMADHATGPGDPLTTAWRLAWPAQWLLGRDAPFWQTNLLYPASNVFARDELTLGQSLIAGPLYALTRNALLAYNLTLLLTLALSGFAMYCMIWHFLRSRSAAIIAGIVFTFAPYHLAQLDHAGLLAVQWLPLVLLFLDRTLRTRAWRDAALFGAAVLVQALSAGYYAYWTAITILLFIGYLVVTRRARLSWRSIGRIVAALAIAFGLLLPIIYPFTKVAHGETFARPLREVEYWSARPQTWLAATPDSLLYGRLVRNYAWTWSTEMYLFPGGIAVALAAGAIFGRRRSRFRWFALGLTLCGVVLTLGPFLHLARRDAGRLPLPYLLLYRLVPGGDALRAPVRAAPLAMLGLALLAAIGWKRIAAWLRRHRVQRWVRSAVAVAVCVGLCAEYATAPLHTVRVPQLDGGAPSLVAWLRNQPPGIVAVLPDLRAPVTMALATTNRHRFLNGDAEILPPATRALFQTLTAFPDRASIGALEALGVNLLVLDRRAYDATTWERTMDDLFPFAADLTPAATLPDATIFRVAPMEMRYGPLRAAIPPSAAVLIGDVPADDPTFLDRALLTQVLRDRRMRGTLATGWTSAPAPPKPGERQDFGLFGMAETIPDAFDGTHPVWTDGTLALYRARSG